MATARAANAPNPLDAPVITTVLFMTFFDYID
jgi:hypothetical protein